MSSVGVSPFLKSGNLALAGVVPASQLQRPAPPMAATSVAAVDQLTGGLPRGALSEICGPASSGRSSLLLAALAARTAAGEACALVDVSDSFDPVSAEAAGVDLRRLLWIRCGRADNHRGHGGKEEQKKNQARGKGSRPPAAHLRPRIAGKKEDERTNVEAAIEAGVLHFDPDHDYNAQHLPYEDAVSRSSSVVRRPEERRGRRFRFQVSSCRSELSLAEPETGNWKPETFFPRAGAEGHGLPAAGGRLRDGGGGFGRRARARGAAHPADLVVPLPPRGGEHGHGARGRRAGAVRPAVRVAGRGLQLSTVSRQLSAKTGACTLARGNGNRGRSPARAGREETCRLGKVRNRAGVGDTEKVRRKK